MSNFGPPPYMGAAYDPNTSTAPPASYGYSGMPQYAYAQQNQSFYRQPQAQPAMAVSAPHCNTYAYNPNGHGARTPSYVNGTAPSPYARVFNFQAPNTQRLTAFPTSPNELNGQSKPSHSAVLPPTHSTMSSFQAPPHNSIPSNNVGSQTEAANYTLGELLAKPQASEQDLEDGEVSSEGSDAGQSAMDNNTQISEHRQSDQPIVSKPGLKPDFYKLAHNLVREMHSWGLSFQDFVNEGMDAGILRKIYTESNLPIVAMSTRPRQPLTEGQRRGLSGAYAEPSEKEMTSKSRAAFSGSAQQPQTEELRTKASRSPKVSSQSVVVDAFAGAKPMDRKVLIAQKLAAKKAGPTSSSKAVTLISAEDPRPSPFMDVKLSSPKQAAFASSSLNEKHTISSLETPKTSEEPQPHVEANRKAQTELARERMEASKQGPTTEKEKQPSVYTDYDGKSAHDTPYAGTSHISSDIQTTRIGSAVQAPSSKASYFSLASQSLIFNIPGLFPAVGSTSHQEPYEVTTRTTDGNLPTIRSRSSTQHFAGSDKGKELTPCRSSLATSDESTGQVSPNRQRASDSVGFHPNRLNRPLTQDDKGVIIDISDEEDTGSEDDFEQKMADGRVQNMQRNREPESGDAKEPVAKIVYPSRDMSARRLPRSSSAAAMPSAALTAGKIQEPEELKSKEMEIELMNRKIAELEQRIKAKHAASRTQSPGFAAQASIAPTPSDLPFGNAYRQTEKYNNIQAGNTDQGNSSATLEHHLATEKERLAEEEIQMCDLDSAETEIPNPALSLDMCQGGQQDKVEPTTRSSLEDDRQSDNDHHLSENSSQLQAGVRCELATSPQKLPQISPGNMEISDTEPSRTHVHRSLSLESCSQAQQLQLERWQAKSQRKRLDPGRQSRKAEIESGLPMLNEEIERTKQKLHSLRQQEAQLEAEIQKGINGRQMLLDELTRLSQTAEALDLAEEVDDHEGASTLQSTLGPGAGKSSESHALGGVRIYDKAGDARPPSDSYAQAILPDDHETLRPSPMEEAPKRLRSPSTLVSLKSRDSERSNAELEEDGMDISRSDFDEGEIIDSPHNSVASDSTEDMDDGEIADFPPQPRLDNQEGDLGAGGTSHYASRPDTEINASGTYKGNLREELLESNIIDDASGVDDEEIYEPPNDISTLQSNVTPGSDTHEASPTNSFPSAAEEGNDSRQQDEPNGNITRGMSYKSDAPPSVPVHNDGASSASIDTTYSQEQANQQVPLHSEIQGLAVLNEDSEDDYEPPDNVPPSGMAQKFGATSVAPAESFIVVDGHDVRGKATNWSSID